MLRSALPSGLRASFAASSLGRLPAGAIGLILVLLVHERTGSFAAGGAVAAANAVGFALGAPVLGRLVDRRGQPRVLLAGAAIHAAGIVWVALLPADAPLLAAIAGAAVAGAAYPPLSSALRAVWNSWLDDPAARHAAYALDSVAGELMYIAGPLVLVAGIGAWSFQAAAVAGAALTLMGTVAYVATGSVRRWRAGPEAGSHGLLGAMRSRGMWILTGGTVLLGVAVAGVEMGVAAFATGEGSKGATGIVLAMWGVGSMLGGIWAARRGPGEDPPTQLAVMLAAVAVCTAPLAAAPGVAVLALLIVPAGFFIAPALALAWGLSADLTPEGTVTEASTWMNTGFGTGIGFGATVGGHLVEGAGPEAAFLGAAAFIAASALLVGALRAGLTVRPAAAQMTA